MKTFFVALFLALPVYFCLAQKHINTTTVSPSKFLDSIQFEYVYEKIIVEATIEGVKGRFLVDTGAPMVLSQRMDSLIRPKLLSWNMVSDANGKTQKTKYVTLQNLQLGEVNFSTITALVLDIDKIPLGCFELDGLIGSNVFHKMAIHFNWDLRTMVLANDYKRLGMNKSEAKKIKFNSYQKTPYVRLKSGDVTSNAIIDTGSGGDISLPNALLEYGALEKKVVGTAKGTDSFGVFGYTLDATFYRIELDSIQIEGGALFPATLTTANDNTAKLGMKIMELGNLTIDYKRNLLFWEATQPFISDYFTFGIEMGFDGESMIVSSVWEGSAAQKAGVSPGDEVIQIGDLVLKEFAPCEVFMKRLRPLLTENEILNFVFDVKGDRINVDLEKIK